jgi:hypothetical protein
VSPILYEAPVVQDIGLFLHGVENPVIKLDRPRRVYWDLPECRQTKDAGDQAVPYSKNKLLGQVKRLYFVHASSSKSTGPAYMLTRDTSRWETPLGACNADILGTQDLKSWFTARNIVCDLKSKKPHSGFERLHEAFSQLKSMSFGTWDTGRWNHYQHEVFEFLSSVDDASSEGNSEHGLRIHDVKSTEAEINRDRKACPQVAINAVLHSIFFGTRSLITCHDALALIVPSFMDGNEDGFMVVHKSPISHRHYQKTRIYTTTTELRTCLSDAMKGYGGDLLVGCLYFSYNSQMKPEFCLTTPPLHHVLRFDLEICLMPETEGDEGQLKLARDVRNALETFKKASKEQDRPRMKILVGDDIPACPCCGGRR